MTTSVSVLLECMLLALAPGAHADDDPKLPPTYAEVVLRVEGMT